MDYIIGVTCYNIKYKEYKKKCVFLKCSWFFIKVDEKKKQQPLRSDNIIPTPLFIKVWVKVSRIQQNNRKTQYVGEIG